MPSCGTGENQGQGKTAQGPSLQWGGALQDTGPGPEGDLLWLVLILLIYLKGQRDAHGENMVCCPQAGGGIQTQLSEIKASSFFACFYCDKVMVFLGCFPGKQKQLFSLATGEPPESDWGRSRSRASNAQVPSPVHGLVQQDLKNISDFTHGTAQIQPPLHRSQLPTGLPAVA